MILKKPKYLFFLLTFLFCLNTNAQSKKQQELEERRLEIQNELNQINKLLFSNKKKQKTVVSKVEDLSYKVNVRKNLIKVTNQQANLLTSQINKNQKEITNLRDELKLLKERYANMVVKSYKSKNEQSKVMFLLSSSNFQQAYKRLQYIKQFANYQKQQGEEIKIKTKKLQETNTELLAQKKVKQKLIDENRSAQSTLEKELKEQETLIASIKKNMSKYSSQVKSKQREVARIDSEINKIIREAIAKSNKKAGKSSTSNTFALTPEESILANSFVASKGKLPWPVEKGVVKMRYGKQSHPIVKTATIQSNGVRIATEDNAKVRAVFDGVVYKIIVLKRGNPTVLIQHGNYYTAYKNLGKVYVKPGDKVKTKQEIGEVFTNSVTGETMLRFSVFKDAKTQNPSSWIYKM